MLVLGVLEFFEKHLLALFHFGDPVLELVLTLFFANKFFAVLVHQIEFVSSVVQSLDLLQSHLLSHDLSPEVLLVGKFLAVIFVLSRFQHVANMVQILFGIKIILLPFSSIISYSFSSCLLFHLVFYSLHFQLLILLLVVLDFVHKILIVA